MSLIGVVNGAWKELGVDVFTKFMLLLLGQDGATDSLLSND